MENDYNNDQRYRMLLKKGVHRGDCYLDGSRRNSFCLKGIPNIEQWSSRNDSS